MEHIFAKWAGSESMNLADMTENEIKEEFGIPSYKARQIYKWIRKGVEDVSLMTDLPLSLRERISNDYELYWPKVYRKFFSKKDDTVKYLIEMNDGNIVETVLMSYEHGMSICISSQVGCRMGCKFCASTVDGLIRNLTPSEIEGQIRVVSKDSNKRISNVVIMGIGEPLDNYSNVIKALHAINFQDGLSIGYRHITLSTCGIREGIVNLIEEKIPITLALSLHAPNDKIRKQLMPVSSSIKIEELLQLMDEYVKATGRRVTFEYSLIKDVNDSDFCAEELGKLLKGRLCHVNLIDVNHVEGKDFRRGNKKYDFIKILQKYGVNATVRRELGSDISASCGQLKKSVSKEG